MCWMHMNDALEPNFPSELNTYMLQSLSRETDYC
jgi:hypothetical protein